MLTAELIILVYTILTVFAAWFEWQRERFTSRQNMEYIKVVEVNVHETHKQRRLMFVKAFDIFIIIKKKENDV